MVGERESRPWNIDGVGGGRGGECFRGNLRKKRKKLEGNERSGRKAVAKVCVCEREREREARMV